MKKKKLVLDSLKVKSFTTSIDKADQVKGGRWSVGGAGACPHTGDATLDYLGCNTLNDFYCRQQSNGYVSVCGGGGTVIGFE